MFKRLNRMERDMAWHLVRAILAADPVILLRAADDVKARVASARRRRRIWRRAELLVFAWRLRQSSSEDWHEVS